MTRTIWLVADDFGLSPAVDDGILDLLDRDRLSGAGCMTTFPEWPREAARIRRNHAKKAGLHLTLTDQVPLGGTSSLTRGSKLPSFGNLATGITTGRIADADIFNELTLQLNRFEQEIGAQPAYIDGHQHVHFLPPVRRWLEALAGEGRPSLPWLRGAPVAKYAPGSSHAKVAVLKVLSTGFDARLQEAGFAVRGPLAGLYDWTDGRLFAAAVEQGVCTLPDNGVLMTHPGRVDDVLRGRDILTDTRQVELDHLSSDGFGQLLDSQDVEMAR